MCRILTALGQNQKTLLTINRMNVKIHYNNVL